jgi:hypothetical protein
MMDTCEIRRHIRQLKQLREANRQLDRRDRQLAWREAWIVSLIVALVFLLAGQCFGYELPTNEQGRQAEKAASAEVVGLVLALVALGFALGSGVVLIRWDEVSRLGAWLHGTLCALALLMVLASVYWGTG